VGSKAFGGLNRRLKEKTAESRWFETTGQAPFGRAKAAYWKIKKSPAQPPEPQQYSRKQEMIARLQARESHRECDLWYFDGAGFCLEPSLPYAWLHYRTHFLF
jgi:hypothetical protein